MFPKDENGAYCCILLDHSFPLRGKARIGGRKSIKPITPIFVFPRRGQASGLFMPQRSGQRPEKLIAIRLDAKVSIISDRFSNNWNVLKVWNDWHD